MTDINDTLAERGARYGDFTDHADIAQDLQDVMRKTAGWDKLSAAHRQSLTVIADKIARILNGDPNYRDNWHDIAGYSKLAEDRCVDTSGPQLPLPQPPAADDVQAAHDRANGWIKWEGRDIPPIPGPVEVKYRDGRTGRAPDAFGFDWTDFGGPAVIVAYRPFPFEPPK